MPRFRQGSRARAARPRTVMGLWLYALLTGDAERRRRLSGQLNGGRIGFNRDEAGVVQAACELAVRQFWGSGYDVRDITEAVTFMRKANQARGRTPYGQLEMETVIRAALGETDVDTAGILRPMAFEIHGAVTGSSG